MKIELSSLVRRGVTSRLLPRFITEVDAISPPAGFKEGRFLVFLAGGRASGKSTLLHHLFDKLADDGFHEPYIGKFGSFIFDDILSIPGVKAYREVINRFAKDNITGGRKATDGLIGHLMDRGLDTCFAQGSPIIIDHHGDSPLVVNHALEKAALHGYETIMVSPHIKPETYFTRAAERQARSGRPFDRKSGLQTHKDFATHLPGYMNRFDLTVLLDNDRPGLTPTPVAIATPHEHHILDEKTYADILRKAHLNPHATTPQELYDRAGEIDPLVHAHTDRMGESHGKTPSRRAGEAIGPYTARLKEMFVPPHGMGH